MAGGGEEGRPGGGGEAEDGAVGVLGVADGDHGGQQRDLDASALVPLRLDFRQVTPGTTATSTQAVFEPLRLDLRQTAAERSGVIIGNASFSLVLCCDPVNKPTRLGGAQRQRGQPLGVLAEQRHLLRLLQKLAVILCS